MLKGFGSLYRGMTAEAQAAAFRAQPDAPELITIDDEVPYDLLPSLYRAADALVQPYRGEGFCLHALKALACGKPLIVTAGGPTDEFASDACAWRIPSSEAPLPAPRPPGRPHERKSFDRGTRFSKIGAQVPIGRSD